MRIICTKKEEEKYTINNELLAPKRIILVAYLWGMCSPLLNFELCGLAYNNNI